MVKIRRMFPGGNTAIGFYSLHDNIIGSNRKKLYILKGMPGGGKSSMMKVIADRMIKEELDIEYHHCPSDPDSIDAIVIEELRICLLDGTAPHIIDPQYPGITDTIIDLGQFIDTNILQDKKQDIIDAKIKNKYAYRKAFNYFKAAKTILEEITEDNSAKLDIKKINKESKKMIDKIFAKKYCKAESNGFQERHLFSTAYTPDGFVDYTNSILEWVEDKYYISGEIGSGKSIILKRVLEEARIRNYQVEVYYNSLIPDKIETVFIKDLDTIITSNKNGDNVTKTKLDLNKYFDNSKLNKEDYKVFNLLVQNGIESLSGAKENHFILEKSYRPAIDYVKVTEVREKLFKEIMSYKKGF